MKLEGIPTDQLPDVLATGRSDINFALISMSAREPDGRDAEYIEWHSLDHRPEQYRLAGLCTSLRLVSTPACRSVRAASTEEFDAVDHVMTYLFESDASLPAFIALGGALDVAGRMPLRLPSVAIFTANTAGRSASPRAVAGADVMPWRPATGVYLIVEDGQAPAEALVNVPGVAGAWWHHGALAPEPYRSDARGRQFTYCYLDDDPVVTGRRLDAHVRARWASGDVRGLLAAPFFNITPFEWARRLPNRD